MKIVKEKTELLLMEYAAGALDEGCMLMMASYVSVCPQARAYVRQCENFGGALMEYQCSPVSMHKGSLQSVLERLDQDEPASDECSAGACGFCEEQRLPEPIAKHINKCAPNARWRKMNAGVQSFMLPAERCTYQTRLVKMEPGAKTRAHSHPGTELTLVLKGEYSDEYGQYSEGDFIIIDEQIKHQPVAGKNGCLCLISTDIPVRFSGSFHTIINFFSR